LYENKRKDVSACNDQNNNFLEVVSTCNGLCNNFLELDKQV